ncbi:MAG: helix-turn-helix domain-containing protein [Desulfobacterales bacterium]|nr:helix-turn-helix domain-containing protein [Desulfobacterales bacterium]
MIEADKRKAIYLLHKQGMGTREISRRFNISTNTVNAIIGQGGELPQTTRKDKIELDSELLRRIYHQCRQRVQRTHEVLSEDYGIRIGYSTLSRMIRELALGQHGNSRCHQVPDQPGAEMQHDTSPYRVKFVNTTVLVQGSLLYFRYCKLKYLKFYRAFDRFKMKCFFHEALSFFDYVAEKCIIDNTSLARLYGTGKNAVINPQMAQFAKQYGFEFICHEKGHANRKAGNERGFYTVETNFFPGREFDSLEDMNRQAFEWATLRMANRPTTKTRLIPAQVFEYEKTYLKKLPAYVPAPYLVLQRGTDQYGYAAFDGNYYWVPGTTRHDVKVLQYARHLMIYRNRKLLGRYRIPPDGVKNKRIPPEGQQIPPHMPKNRKKPATKQENILRAAAKPIDDYLSFAIKNGVKQKHRFIRQLYALYRNIAFEVFINTLSRALKYRITDIKTIERIATLQLTAGDIQLPLPLIDAQLEKRDAYIEGCLADDVDLSVYDNITEDDDG